LTRSNARLSRLDAPANAAADDEYETGLDETRPGLAALPFEEMSETGMDAMRRALDWGGTVCLDELTRRATGFGCLAVWASPATGVARVNRTRMNVEKWID
jgi:hypothetical protein